MGRLTSSDHYKQPPDACRDVKNARDGLELGGTYKMKTIPLRTWSLRRLEVWGYHEFIVLKEACNLGMAPSAREQKVAGSSFFHVCEVKTYQPTQQQAGCLL